MRKVLVWLLCIPLAMSAAQPDKQSGKAEVVYLQGYFRGYLESEDTLTYYQDGIVEFFVSDNGEQPLGTKSRVPQRNFYLRLTQAEELRTGEMGILLSSLQTALNEPLMAKHYADAIDFSHSQSQHELDGGGTVFWTNQGSGCEVALRFGKEKSAVDTIVRAITVFFGVDMKVDEIEMFQNYKKNNDREFQLSDLISLGSALRLEMSSECQPPRKLFAKTEVYITDCKPVSQKEADRLYNAKPEKGKLRIPASVPPLNPSVSSALKEMTVVPVFQ